MKIKLRDGVPYVPHRKKIGLAGVILKLSGFQMKNFNTAGDTVVVRRRVLRKWVETDQGYVEFEVWSKNLNGVSVGPGRIIAVMPRLAIS